jgi:crossover junction endodeoxyribonuclease RuvC
MIDIRDQILQLLPTSSLVAIESFSMGSRGRAVFQLGGLGWLVRADLYENHISYIDVTPAELKKFTTGKGNAKKDVMMREVYKRWGVNVDTSDEADAFALAMFAMERVKEDEG